HRGSTARRAGRALRSFRHEHDRRDPPGVRGLPFGQDGSHRTGIPPPLMSLKYAVEKISDNHYVLPRSGEMKVDAHAFFSENLYDRSEEPMWHQLAQAASYEGVIGAYLMPDAHVGYGVPVGCVVVTDGVIIQAGSGYDISCGVVYMKATGLTAEDVASLQKRRAWIDAVERRIATGVGTRAPKQARHLPQKKTDDIL